MAYMINKDNGISNRGNQTRIKNVFKRALAGEKLTLGFLGGSITQGSLATEPTLCYAYRVFEWWQKTFKDAEFSYVNAGIGGTTSQFGVARAESDLLSKEPDFVIIEFSVNDESDEHFLETYEGLVRKVYGSKKKPAVLLVHNVYYNNGANAQLMHSRIGRHYDLPSVSMQSSIYPEVVAGRIMNREITPDDLHPNDLGHELVAEVITHFLGKIKDAVTEEEKAEVQMPEPLTVNGYENSVRYRNMDIEPVMDGFVADTTAQRDITDCFKNGWTAIKAGSRIEFEVEGTGVSVQYRKSVKHPVPIAKIVVDNDEKMSKILDANFDETWGDKLELDTIAEHIENKKHNVKIELIQADDACVEPFYLVSLIIIK